MSTYYEFRCPICKKTGGFFSRQMWGWGNADVVANHKFLMKHVAECQATSVDVLSEHDDGYGENEDAAYKESDYWPHSDDWEFLAGGATWDEWVTKEAKQDADV